MKTLKKLAADCWTLAPHMQSVAKCTELENVAAKLDAYIKAQESAEPVAWRVIRDSGTVHPWNNGKPRDGDVQTYGAHTRSRIEYAYAAPPPREPITQEAVYLAAKKLELTHLALEFGGLLSELGIEVKP